MNAVTVKRSISLTDAMDAKLEKIRKNTGSSSSDIIEAALAHFSSLTNPEINNLISQTIDDKKVSTAAGWRALFWSRLAETLGYLEFQYDSRFPYGPREFCGCQVLFLMTDGQGGIYNNDLIIHIFKTAHTGSLTLQTNSTDMHYRVGDHVLPAVSDAVKWIKQNGDRS